MARILIADDQIEILHALKLLLKQEGHQTALVSSPDGVLSEAKAAAFDLILIDLNYTRDTTSGKEGLDLLEQLSSIPHRPPIIVMTAWSTVPLAVEAMRAGAVDFIEKPWDNTKVLSLVERHLRAPEPVRSGLSPAKDLEIARNVQHRLLPQRRPDLATVEYAVSYHPAGQVGGDYYDFLPLGPGEMAFLVADVSGKGISAAILMATLQSFFRSRCPEDFDDLGALVSSLNSLFFQSSPPEQFATLFLMRYSDRTRAFEYVNCGHVPPLMLKADLPPIQLDPTATVIGLFESWSGTVRGGKLEPGETVLIFSDGLTEAANTAHEEFGEERLQEAWSRTQGLEIPQALDQLGRAIRAHSEGALIDDLTILALRGKAAGTGRDYVIPGATTFPYEARYR